MEKNGQDYEVVARAIRFLTENALEQPTLEDTATHVRLSKFHFQRLFKRLTGISPKQFLQTLTAYNARRLLTQSISVLDTALEVGLSGPGRLHDLMITLEAMTPGEIKEGGRNQTIRYGIAATPFGQCLVARTNRGICRMSFLESDESNCDVLSSLKNEWPNAEIVRDDSMADGIAAVAFDQVVSEPITLHVRGTNFQVQVWRAILSIPPGCVTTYGRIASTMRSPGATRAVGRALASNPVALLIPCHRVIREAGIIGDYHWGAYRKTALLAWEAARETAIESISGS